MFVLCKGCGGKLVIPGWPGGSNSLANVHANGSVHIGDGAIRFGPGGSIGFGSGGVMGFGGPPKARIQCAACRFVAEYERQDARD